MTANQLIKKVRASQESTEQIAFKAGVSYSWLAKFTSIKGMKSAPRKSTLNKLAAYFEGKT